LTGKFPCQICNSESLGEVEGFADLPRVTSDCKPWPRGGQLVVCDACGAVQKLPTSVWFNEINQIYAQYQIYHLAGGAEQPIFFADGSATPRSRALVKFVVDEAALPDRGKLLDIGCGNGAALANFANALPNWRLSGAELSDTALPRLRQIEAFEQLYTGSLNSISGRFDLVTMIHALEHMPSPQEAMRNAARILESRGDLFVEIPNLATSPFDVLVADHLLHFTPAHLAYISAQAGLSSIRIRDDVLPKEISMLASPGISAVERPDPSVGKVLVQSNISWLRAVLDSARDSAEKARVLGRPFGVFGTSISGMWLFGALRTQIAFFVDEDVNRIGSSHEGIPILAPDQLPRDAVVFLPLASSIASQVARRLSNSGSASFQTPPSFN
jgi:2-polyprenyl-3-methyl-5-hydroxy-6-metoxy-1,4-benzoquinol methylase